MPAASNTEVIFLRVPVMAGMLHLHRPAAVLRAG
jgi:hypothetical protein